MATNPTTLNDLYALIKSYEDLFPIPAPSVTVNVGTFDAASGSFTGLTTRTTTDPEPIQHKPGQHPVNPPAKFEGSTYVITTINSEWRETVTSVPAPDVPLAPVKLQFSVANFSSAWSVTVHGVTTSVPAGQASVSVNIWDLQDAVWVMQVGGRSHQDSLMIQRPVGQMGLGVGAFTIPALPITIVYAPPKDSLGKSSATYTQVQTTGTSITTSFGTDTSTTNPNMQTAYAAGADLVDVLDIVGQALGLAGQGEATAAKAVQDISSEIGKFSSTFTKEISNTTEDKLTFAQTLTQGFGTQAVAGGPGTGDVIVIAKNVQMIWVCTGSQLALTPIDFETRLVPAGALAANPGQFEIAQADAEFLLSFDPFATGGPDADVDPNRFQFLENIGYTDGAVAPISLSFTNSNIVTTTEKTVTTDTNEWDAGPLFQLFGLGGKTSTSVSAVNTTESDASTTVTAAGNLVSGPGDNFVVNIYYDTIFGTFAFQQEQPAVTPLLTGNGTAAGQLVTLISGGRVFKTVTDANGKFAFHARSIPPGPATLTIGNQAPTLVNVSAVAAELQGSEPDLSRRPLVSV